MDTVLKAFQITVPITFLLTVLYHRSKDTNILKVWAFRTLRCKKPKPLMNFKNLAVFESLTCFFRNNVTVRKMCSILYSKEILHRHY